MAEVNVTGLAGFLLAKFAASTIVRASFADSVAQGPVAYADQILIDHPDLDRAALLADAVVAVESFHDRLTLE